MLYVPTNAVVSHYFKKKRALALTFVAGGSSLGTLILPILLNNLLSRVGYGRMTLFSAALITFTLVIACSLLRAPLPTSISRPPMMKSMRQNFKDWPLIMISVGLVVFLEPVNGVTESVLILDYRSLWLDFIFLFSTSNWTHPSMGLMRHWHLMRYYSFDFSLTWQYLFFLF